MEKRDRGQVLVLLALGLLALVAMVALAVDGGHIYRQRRAMQNAADAGALAGAYELCYGEESQIVPMGEEYAIDRNGADGAIVEWVTDTISVTVTATETVSTYFAGVIGFREVEVSADATAICGRAAAGGLIWPISYSDEYFKSKSECDTPVLMWDQEQSRDCVTWDCCTYYDDTEGSKYYDGEDNGIDVLDLCTDPDDPYEPDYADLDGHTWIDMSAGLYGTEDPCNQSGCGNNELNDRVIGYNKDDEVCQSYVQLNTCVPGSSGVKNDSWTAAGFRVDDIVLIPLYEPISSTGGIAECTSGGDSGDNCTNENYWLTDFGCVKILGIGHLEAIATGNTTKVVLGEVSCDQDACETLLGYTDGTPPRPGDARAVSLVE
jgi:hypothetical protein